MRWKNNPILSLFGIDIPIIQAPMAGADSALLAIEVMRTGGLGSLACATLSAEQIIQQVHTIRNHSTAPFNLNFFCHRIHPDNPQLMKEWEEILMPYYQELGIDINASFPFTNRMPFDDILCSVVETLKPPIISFHFGLPATHLLERVKATGSKILASATTVEEACWLEKQGCDAIIAQGVEAGGHRGLFLRQDTATQMGTIALVPQIVDAVAVPVIAAGGIADARGIAAALTLGASAVQLGTAYLFCPEASISPLYRHALENATPDITALTNIFTGKPARGIINRLMQEMGPLSDKVPAFPLAARLLAPLRAKAESYGSTDFTSLWAGQGVALCRKLPAGQLTQRLAEETLQILTCSPLP